MKRANNRHAPKAAAKASTPTKGRRKAPPATPDRPRPVTPDRPAKRTGREVRTFATAKGDGLTSIEALTLDPQNARSHGPRNLDVIGSSLQAFGAARSIVIDEHDQVIAGGGVVEAARHVGLSAVRVVETDGQTIIAVRRRGLSTEDKRRLAIADNRSGELSTWNLSALSEQLENIATTPDALAVLGFTERELADLIGSKPSYQAEPDPGRPATGAKTYIFQFGDYRGRVSDEVYSLFVAAFSAQQEANPDAVLLDDVLRAWFRL